MGVNYGTTYVIIVISLILTSSAKTINIEESPVNSEDSNISINQQLKTQFWRETGRLKNH